MADPHYLDNNLYGDRMGAAFSDAVTGIKRLQLAELQRRDQQAYNLAQFRLAQQRLGLEQEREKREAATSAATGAREQSVYNAAGSGADAFARMYTPTAPLMTAQGAQQDDMQTLARSLAFVRGINPASAGKALEAQQFSPGPVYGWNAMLPGMQQPPAQLPSGFGQVPIQLQGGPQPIMNVPPPAITPQQQQQDQIRNYLAQIALQRMLTSQQQGEERLGQGQQRLGIEQQRANQAQDPIKALVRGQMQNRMGTNQVGRFSIRPKVTEDSANTDEIQYTGGPPAEVTGTNAAPFVQPNHIISAEPTTASTNKYDEKLGSGVTVGQWNRLRRRLGSDTNVRKYLRQHPELVNP